MFNFHLQSSYNPYLPPIRPLFSSGPARPRAEDTPGAATDNTTTAAFLHPCRGGVLHRLTTPPPPGATRIPEAAYSAITRKT